MAAERKRARHAQRCRERREAKEAGTYVDRRKAGPGRPPGVLNRITRDVREMIRDFAERKAVDFENWIERVAVKEPAKAATLYLAAIEYHIPRLQRTDVRVAALPAFVGDPTVVTDPVEAAGAYARITRGEIALNSIAFEPRPVEERE